MRNCWMCGNLPPGRLADVCPACDAVVQKELEAQRAWVRVMPRECPMCGRRQHQCSRTCPMVAGIERAWREDREWFARHPAATERIRPFTVEEHLGWFLNNGKVRTEQARILRTGRWFTYNGRRTHEVLSTYEVEANI